MPWRGVTVSGPGLDVPRIRVIELKTGYENARSQDLSSCPLPIAIGKRSYSALSDAERWLSKAYGSWPATRCRAHDFGSQT